jgi:peptide/nickel transport system substrate-binding protein
MLRLKVLGLLTLLALGGVWAQSNPPLVVGADAGSPTFIDNFNPFNGQRMGRLFMYEPLAIINPFSGQATPWLATSWHFTDPLTLVVQVRSGVKWSDGVPFTAQDVAFTFNLLKQYPPLDSAGLWQVLKSVEAKGSEVVFHYATPAVPTLSQILSTPIVPEHVWAKVKDPVKYTDPNPVVTGPYVLASFAPYEYILKKNPLYWQASKVQVPEIVFPSTPSNNQLFELKLADGKYDWAYVFIPDVQSTYASKSPYNRYWFAQGGIVGLFMNLKKPPFTDPAFRRAIAYAINRVAIAAKAEYGYVTIAPQSLLTMPAQKAWLNPALPNQGYIPYDPAKAKQILEQAGYTWNAQGQLEQDGHTISFTLQIPTGWTDWIQTSTIIAQDLGKLGIQVNVITPTAGVVFADQSDGNFEASLSGAGGQPDPYWSYYYLLNPHNTYGWVSQKTTQLLDNWRATVNLAQQKHDAYELQSILFQKVPFIPLFYGGLWNEYNTQHYVGWPSPSDPYTSPTPWMAGAPLMVVTHLHPR